VGSVRWTWLSASALVAALGVAGAASCGAPSIDDDELVTGIPLPDRSAGDPTTDAAAETTSAPPADSAPDAAVDAPTQAALCGAPDLVLCFGFEGAVVDGSPNALVPAISGVSFVPGKSGQAGLFGPLSAVTFGASPAFELTAATIEAWVNLAANPPGDGVIFDDDNRASLTILADGTLLCKPTGVPSAGKVAVGQWTHVACVFDGANVRAYVNGVEVGSGAGVIASSPASTAALGGNAPSGEPFVGAIDSFRVFKVARSPAQIAAAAGL
jgi:hypothetical protein